MPRVTTFRPVGAAIECIVSPTAREHSSAKAFIPIWFIAAGINLWIGVKRAGYSFGDEAPIFAIVFAVPAAVALFLWWKLAR
jgi:hypothetical protein